MIRTYYLLTKPGIIFGNIMTTVAGFLLASHGSVDVRLFLMTIVGLSLVIGSACVFNNYVDRDLDQKMERTKGRPLAVGLISLSRALLFGSVLGLLGSAILAVFTNVLTLALALTGFFIYVVLYSFWKRSSTYSTIVGSVSGAIPIVVGYTAVQNSLDLGALILFAILVFWQMPHFFAIAIYRLQDYRAASVVVLPVIKGTFVTKLHMLFYVVGFTVATLLLSLFGYTGYTYLAVSLFLSMVWLLLCFKGFTTGNERAWAKSMFLYSLVIILVLSLMMAMDFSASFKRG